MKKYWPLIVPFIPVIISTFTPEITQFISDHPRYTLLITTILGTLQTIAKSPAEEGLWSALQSMFSNGKSSPGSSTTAASVQTPAD